MTHRAAGSAGGVPRIWLLPIPILTILLGVTAAGFLSRSIVVDLIAWWPAWLALALITFLARGRTLGKVRASGLIPLLATAALVVFAVAHVSGWVVMPSASQRLVGPEPDPSLQASLTARIDGEVLVNGGGQFLYQVDPVRRGGTVGVPSAREDTQGLSISVTLEEPTDPGFYAFSGWEITLTSLSLWDLTLEGNVEADLRDLEITGLELFGEGTVTLDSTDYDAPVGVVGTYELVIDDTVPARVVGEGEVPSTWTQTSDGWASPAPGSGWVISASEGSSLTVVSG